MDHAIPMASVDHLAQKDDFGCFDMQTRHTPPLGKTDRKCPSRSRRSGALRVYCWKVPSAICGLKITIHHDSPSRKSAILFWPRSILFLSRRHRRASATPAAVASRPPNATVKLPVGVLVLLLPSARAVTSAHPTLSRAAPMRRRVRPRQRLEPVA